MKGKKIIIIIIILFVISAYIIAFIKLNNKKNIKLVTNAATFFSIQYNINYFLNNYNEEKLLNMLDDTYLKENSINKNNVLKMTSEKYTNPNFTAKSIKYYKRNNIYYYFVQGYIIDIIYNAFNNDENNTIYNSYDYYKSKNYLLIVNNDKFIINPLEDNINMDDYIKKYNNEIKVLSKGEVFENTSTSEKNKLITYLSEYKKLLYIDPEKSYNLLDEATKSKYSSYNYYYSNIDNINNYINISINSYSSEKVKNDYIYNIVLKSGKSIKIIEKNIMDYKIDF